MIRKVLLASAALTLVAGAADARPQVTMSHDNKFVSTMPGNSHFVSKRQPPGAYKYTTLDKGEGAYFCCYGSTISGPTSFFGAAYGVAEQFSLSAAATVKKLAAGVGYVSGTHVVILTLYADNGNNSPGAQLAQGTGTTTTQFGFCCGVTHASIPATALAANTPYWVAITAGGSDFDAAGFQVSDEVDGNVYVASTTNGGTSWGAGVSETEYNPAIGVK